MWPNDTIWIMDIWVPLRWQPFWLNSKKKRLKPINLWKSFNWQVYLFCFVKPCLMIIWNLEISDQICGKCCYVFVQLNCFSLVISSWDKSGIPEIDFLPVADHPNWEKLSTLSFLRAADAARDACSYDLCSFVLKTER